MSEQKVVPITRGHRRPKPGWITIIVGRTRVDLCIDPRQRVRRPPAAIIELASQKSRTDTEPDKAHPIPTNQRDPVAES
jgi:hypothetical protein